LNDWAYWVKDCKNEKLNGWHNEWLHELINEWITDLMIEWMIDLIKQMIECIEDHHHYLFAKNTIQHKVQEEQIAYDRCDKAEVQH